jgi:hypothetical protein
MKTILLNVVFANYVPLQAVSSRRPSAMEVPEVPFLSSFQKNQQSSQKYEKNCKNFMNYVYKCNDDILQLLCSVGSALASFVRFDKKYSTGASLVSIINISVWSLQKKESCFTDTKQAFSKHFPTRFAVM